MAHDAGAFRLEVGVFPIQRMTFASETRYQDGTLSIDRAALLAAIAEPRSSPIWKSTWPILGSHAALSMCSIPSLPWLKYRAARRSIRGSSTRPCRLGMVAIISSRERPLSSVPPFRIPPVGRSHQSRRPLT